MEERRMAVHTMNDVKLYDFPQHGDERGHLVVVEGGERCMGGGYYTTVYR